MLPVTVFTLTGLKSLATTTTKRREAAAAESAAGLDQLRTETMATLRGRRVDTRRQMWGYTEADVGTHGG